MSTSVLHRPTAEKVCQVFLARSDIWRPRWQEAIEEQVLYRTWEDDAPWWNEPTPQRAWDACPSGEAMLWVMSRDYLTCPPWYFRLLGLRILEHALPGKALLFQALKDGMYQTPKMRMHVANKWERLPSDPDTLPKVHARMCFAIALASYGYTKPFFELAYYTRVFGGLSDEALADVIRAELPKEMWTRGL